MPEKNFYNILITNEELGPRYFQVLEDYTLVPLSESEVYILFDTLKRKQVTSEIHGFVDTYLTNFMMVNFGHNLKVMIDHYDEYFKEDKLNGVGYNTDLYWLIQSYVTDHLEEYQRESQTINASKPIFKKITRRDPSKLPTTLYLDTKGLNREISEDILKTALDELQDKGHIRNIEEVYNYNVSKGEGR